jgi:hypothetical protein
MKANDSNQNRKPTWLLTRFAASLLQNHLLVLLALLGLPSGATAQFTFLTNSGTVTVIGYTGPGGSVTIPSSTGALPVTGIAFLGIHYNVNSLSIPASVTSITADAFGFR